MDPSLARRLWRVLEPYHAVVYFAPEKKGFYEEAGLKGGWMGYFASRAAAMGPVPAEVVIATFYNFHPDMVKRAIPDAWTLSSPTKVLEARQRTIDAALRRLLGDTITSPDLERAGLIASEIASRCSPVGRPLFAAHAALSFPEEPHLALWHAATLLREFRGDGHVTALVTNEIDGCEAHVLITAAGVASAEMMREYRRWSEDEWRAAVQRLRQRSLLSEDGSITDEGSALRDRIEDLTDRLALPPFESVGEDRCLELEGLMRAIVRRIHDSAGIEYPNPIGLEREAN